MEYYNGERIYIDQNNNKYYYEMLNPTITIGKSTYNINSYNNQNYTIPINQPQNNIYFYLTPEQNNFQNILKIPIGGQNFYDTTNNIDIALTTNKIPYLTTPDNYNSIYPKQKLYNNTLNNNAKQKNIRSRNKADTNFPIQKYKTMFQRPSKNMQNNFEEKMKVSNENNTNKNNLNLINNGIINIKPQNIQNQNQNKEKNIIIGNQIIDAAIVTKIDNKNRNSLNLKNNKNLQNKNNIYNTQIYQNYFPVKDYPTNIEEFKTDVNNYQINYNMPESKQNSIYSSQTHKISRNYYLDKENTKNNKIIKENKNPYLNDQFIYQYNNENNKNENPIIYQTQTFNNKNYYNSINNIYSENNITSELTKTTEIQKENSDNSNINLISNTTLITNPQSPFYEKNGEIISNSNYERYFRQTSTAPVTSYGYCQNQSQRNYMEDEGKVIENLNGDPNKILFCLFDGHGGGQVSKFLQENFGTYMKKILDTDDYISGFKNLFQIIDEDIKKLNCPTVGSTATIVYIEKKDNKRYLYCANIGDTRCVLVNKNTILRLSYDDRVADEKEKNRILSGGGIIVNERVYGILMLSRSFGDFQTKDFGVIVTPHVVKYELKEDDYYCVIASDGVWDVVKDIDCAVLPKMAKMGMDTGELSRRMINEALKRKSKDNLSCFVISLN